MKIDEKVPKVVRRKLLKFRAPRRQARYGRALLYDMESQQYLWSVRLCFDMTVLGGLRSIPCYGRSAHWEYWPSFCSTLLASVPRFRPRMENLQLSPYPLAQ
jgi:hypothetical protein